MFVDSSLMEWFFCDDVTWVYGSYEKFVDLLWQQLYSKHYANYIPTHSNRRYQTEVSVQVYVPVTLTPVEAFPLPGPRTSLEASEKRKIYCLCQELNEPVFFSGMQPSYYTDWVIVVPYTNSIIRNHLYSTPIVLNITGAKILEKEYIFVV